MLKFCMPANFGKNIDMQINYMFREETVVQTLKCKITLRLQKGFCDISICKQKICLNIVYFI